MLNQFDPAGGRPVTGSSVVRARHLLHETFPFSLTSFFHLQKDVWIALVTAQTLPLEKACIAAYRVETREHGRFLHLCMVLSCEDTTPSGPSLEKMVIMWDLHY
jgi:vancomycin permeability regulator SanA